MKHVQLVEIMQKKLGMLVMKMKIHLSSSGDNLSHTVYFPTRIQNNQDREVDSIFVDNSKLNYFIVSLMAAGPSGCAA